MRKKKKQPRRQREAKRGELPFFPAYDLYEEQKKNLTEDEVAAVGLALALITTPTLTECSPWRIAARVESIARRL